MGVAVTFDDDNVSVHVAPGGRATCSLRVQNTGMTVDGVLLDVLGDVGDWASVEPGEVNLLPGASAPVTVIARSAVRRLKAFAFSVTPAESMVCHAMAKHLPTWQTTDESVPKSLLDHLSVGRALWARPAEGQMRRLPES